MDNALSKSEQIQQYICSQIKKEFYRKDDLLPSEAELQRRFGVSRVTVRAAYRALGERGIVCTKRGAGTYVAHDIHTKLYISAQKKVIRRIGILLPQRIGFFEDLRACLEAELAERSYEYDFVYNTSIGAEREAFQRFVKERYSGLLLSPNRAYFDDAYKNYSMLFRSDMLFVMIGKPPKNIFCNAVYYDDIAGSVALIRQLYYSKCRQVVHVTSFHNDQEALLERREGYLIGMKKFFPNCEKPVFNVDLPEFKSRFIAYLKGTGERLGIILYDNAGYEKIEAIVTEAGKTVGGDVLIFGFNSPLYNLNPEKNVPSIEHNIRLIARKSVDLLELCFYEKKQDFDVRHNILKPEIILR